MSRIEATEARANFQSRQLYFMALSALLALLYGDEERIFATVSFILVADISTIFRI